MVFHRYIKRPITISAEVLTKPTDIQTLEGTMHGDTGDYLVIGVEGEQYVVKKHIFEKTYYRV